MSCIMEYNSNTIYIQIIQGKVDDVYLGIPCYILKYFGIGNYVIKFLCGGTLLLLQNTLWNFNEKGSGLLFCLGIYWLCDAEPPMNITMWSAPSLRDMRNFTWNLYLPKSTLHNRSCRSSLALGRHCMWSRTMYQLHMVGRMNWKHPSFLMVPYNKAIKSLHIQWKF